LSSELADVDSIMESKTGVYVLEDGANAMITRAWLSEYAEKSIDIQYFIFSLDNVGLIAVDYLVRAADRGVKVRILVDDIMVDASIEDILSLAAHKNIDIKIYNPGVNLGKNLWGKLKSFATNYAKANQRMHNKTFIVDNKVVVTGGRNIANEYFDYDHEYNFRDRDILLLGKATKNIGKSFSMFWQSKLSADITKVAKETDKAFADTIHYTALHQYACNPENFWPQVRKRIKNLPAVFSELKKSGGLVWTDSVEFVSDLPGKNDGTKGLYGSGKSTEKLFKLVSQAQKSIDIQTPYLIMTEESLDLFRTAVKRGVMVRILTNSLASTDNVEAFNGYQRSRKKLLKTGVRIFEFRPDAKARMSIMTGELQEKLNYKPIFGLHAKSMVVDGKTTVIGTFNLDPRSANLNTECLVIVKNKKVAQGVLEGMETEFLPENSWETTLESNPDDEVGYGKRIKAATRRIVPQNIL
jgi:phosphatidylserine/phosphatidylglycerophosphate/cardiolipin synthase-like enzyme